MMEAKRFIESDKFEETAKEMIVRYLKEYEISNVQKSLVKRVWGCKLIQHHKGLYTIPGVHMYFEVTFNGDTGEFYLDAYHKIDKITKKTVPGEL